MTTTSMMQLSSKKLCNERGIIGADETEKKEVIMKIGEEPSYEDVLMQKDAWTGRHNFGINESSKTPIEPRFSRRDGMFPVRSTINVLEKVRDEEEPTMHTHCQNSAMERGNTQWTRR